MKNDALQTTSTEGMVAIPLAEYERFQAQDERIAELEHQVELLTEAIRLARHKRFGASSEQSSEDTLEYLSCLFNEAEVYADQEAAEADDTVVVAAHKRHKKHEYTLDKLPENIPVEVVEHRLSEDERECPYCGETMQEIGSEVRETLVFVPAKVILRQDKYYTYACANCEKNDDKDDEKEDVVTPVVKAPQEPGVIPGGFASPEAIAHIMTQKFVMGSPLYRQEQEWARQGLMLSRQTMSNWLLWSAEHWLEPIYDQLHQELVKREVLHADETTLQVLHEPGRDARSKSYMWLYLTGRDAGPPIALYEYQPSRKAEHPKEFLKGFSGYLHTDGYAGYHGLSEDITVVGCWAHARRKFDEAVKSLPKGKAKNSSAAQGLAWCNLLFKIEEGLTELSPKERYEQRLKQEKPVLDAMLAWANSRAAAPKSAFGKALGYLKEQWPYLCNYLKDGRLELSNNRAERSIKPFVIDRKNFLFANTPSGAKSSAVIFSLIETAKATGLDPYRYLTWVLIEAPRLARAGDGWAGKLTPANAPENCRSGGNT